MKLRFFAHFRVLMRVCMFALVIAAAFTSCAAASSVLGWTIEDSVVKKYDVPINATINARANIVGGEGTFRTNLTRIAKISPAVVLGEDEAYYLVDCANIRGYVSKDDVNLDGDMIVAAGDETFSATLTDLVTPTVLPKGSSLRVTGEITANAPITHVAITVYNVRYMKEDYGVSIYFDYDQNVTSFKLGKLSRLLNLSMLRYGEKTMAVTVSSGDKTLTLAERYIYIPSINNNPIRNATSKCAYYGSGDGGPYMCDDDYTTQWVPEGPNDAAVVEIPEEMDAGLIKVEWTKPIGLAHFVMLDANGNVLETITDQYPYDFYESTYELKQGVRAIRITMDDEDNGITEIRMYARNEIPPLVRRWQALPEKVDAMLVVAHRNDETLYFGGTAPYMAVQGKSLAIVCMTACKSREAYALALDAVWALGVKYHPLYLGFEDRKGEIDAIVENWGRDKAYGAVINTIRKYKPDVMLTQDIDGEFGHKQHIFTSELVRNGVVLAKDASQYPESAEKYGAWSVSKLYVHLYEGVPRVDVPFKVRNPALGGLTPRDVAYAAMDKHKQKVYPLDGDGIVYDNTCFGLYYSTVGPDIVNNDFFENIP